MPRPLSFTRAMRLVHKNDFARAFREGRRARGETAVVVVMTNGLEHSRLGLSVGRVIWKSAVKRNRIRRIFRESFRLSYPELPRGVDVIMIPAVPKLVPDLARTRAELVSLVERALARFSDPRPERKNSPAKERKPARPASQSRSHRAPRSKGANKSKDVEPTAVERNRTTTSAAARDDQKPTFSVHANEGEGATR